ncbi:hypothetical protein A6V39_01100 [Candidatus Mycoplasma haematobovis]|uniref:Uncharacterized protein n=1 Tax=Candidatus Mycoplasma haematobovis TaxID=432608 RepID=A0A1A9QG15_9MOLU|nr:hypothetical protein [Candidatus Mycoplasma haematobovis]OAL10650.1 hypothetical protein A6V39_01100 [Candidatus Mycoplasma haematobovis]
MFSSIKFLKIALPVATVTSATIATTLLVSSSKNDLNNKEQDLDEGLKDFSEVNENFKDRKIFYAKNGKGKGTTELSEAESKRIEELMAKGAEITDQGERRDTVPENVDSRPQESSSQPTDSKEVHEPSINLPKTEKNTSQGEPQSQEAKTSVSNKEQSDVKSGGGLDSSNQSDNPDLGNVQGSDEKAGTKEGEVGGDIQQEGEGKLKGEPQTNEINEDNSNDLGEAGKEQSEEQDGDSLTEAKTTEPQNDDSESGSELKTLEHKEDEKDNPKETGKDSNQHQQGSEGFENSNQDQRGSYKESERHQNHQQQDRGEGDLFGDSDVTRFDLAELQRWQNELGSAKDALSEILSKL